MEIFNYLKFINNLYASKKQIIPAMASILDNIFALADHEGISISALERRIDCSIGTLTQAAKKNRNIQARWIEKIAETFPNWSAEWILRGKGAMVISQNGDGHATTNIITGNQNNQNSNNNIYNTCSPEEMLPLLMKIITEKDKQIAEKDEQISKKDEQISGMLALLGAKMQ